MSKTVKFSFPASSLSPKKPSSPNARTIDPPTVKSNAPTTNQSTPSPYISLSTTDPATRPISCKQTPSIQAETGQLKMEISGKADSSHVTIPSNSSASYKTAKTIYQHKGQSTGAPSVVNASTIAEKMRQQFNHQIHEHVKNVKFELASLHEQLIKLEEEIKLGNKAKNVLEVALQEIRKSISTNQQSITAQQKKRREEDSKSEVFLEEAKTLSSIRRKLESQFHVMKHQLSVLDGIRKQMKTKISNLSKSSELDAQRFKVYNGPTSSGAASRHYNTSYPQPTQSNHKELLASVSEGIKTSKAIRAAIKELIASANSTRIQAHEKVTTVVSQSIERAKAHQRQLCLEKGQLRLQQNSVLKKAHNTEIALGMVSGPISDKYKSVAMSENRPLTRSRPASAIEEIECIKNTKASLSRQLSAIESKRSSVSRTDQRLSQSLMESSHHSSLDSQIVRVRKMSLDNRWVS